MLPSIINGAIIWQLSARLLLVGASAGIALTSANRTPLIALIFANSR